MNNEELELAISLYKGQSKKTGREYECVRVSVGDWTGFIFPRSRFEYDYLHKVLGEPTSEQSSEK